MWKSDICNCATINNTPDLWSLEDEPSLTGWSSVTWLPLKVNSLPSSINEVCLDSRRICHSLIFCTVSRPPSSIVHFSTTRGTIVVSIILQLSDTILNNWGSVTSPVLGLPTGMIENIRLVQYCMESCSLVNYCSVVASSSHYDHVVD